MIKVKIGDVVRLRSGGPKMTVGDKSYDNGNVLCQWFQNECLYRGDFKPEELDLVGKS